MLFVFNDDGHLLHMSVHAASRYASTKRALTPPARLDRAQWLIHSFSLYQQPKDFVSEALPSLGPSAFTNLLYHSMGLPHVEVTHTAVGNTPSVSGINRYPSGARIVPFKGIASQDPFTPSLSVTFTSDTITSSSTLTSPPHPHSPSACRSPFTSSSPRSGPPCSLYSSATACSV